MASLNPELITEIAGYPVTNTVVATVIVDILLIAFIFFVARRITMIPKRVQNATEILISYFYEMSKSLSGNRAKTVFPWVMTFFIFILVSNLLGLMPGIGSIGIYPEQNTSKANVEKKTGMIKSGDEIIKDPHKEIEDESHPQQKNLKTDASRNEKHDVHLVSLVRPATSDFNATLALAVISLIATHVLSIKYTGIKNYLSRYFVINPIMLFVGMLELVSEFIKIFSLSFRLFGNIYAGEVVLATISGLFAFLAPLPFLLLESIVAIVQALVFAMLTLVFMSVLTEKHHAAGH